MQPTTGYETVADAHAALAKGYPTDPTVQEVLEATSGEGLLRAYAALTHQIHAAEHPAPRLTIIQSDRLADLRVQRDAVEAEVLRRMGGTR